MTKRFTYENTIAQLKAHPYDLRLMIKTMSICEKESDDVIVDAEKVVNQVLHNLQGLLEQLQKVVNYPLFAGNNPVNHYIEEVKRLQLLITLDILKRAFKDIAQSIKGVGNSCQYVGLNTQYIKGSDN